MQYLVCYQIYTFPITLEIIYNSMDYSISDNNKQPDNEIFIIWATCKYSDKAIYDKWQCDKNRVL